MLKTILRWTFIAVFTGIFTQIPVFTHYYQQSVDAGLVTIQQAIDALDEKAEESNISRFDYVTELLESNRPNDQALGQEHLAQLSYHQFLQNSQMAFDESNLSDSMLLLMLHLDGKLMGDAINRYKLGFIMSVTGAGYVIVGIAIGFLLLQTPKLFRSRDVALRPEEALDHDEDNTESELIKLAESYHEETNANKKA